MSKISRMIDEEKQGRRALEQWYSRQPNGCTCKGILRVTGSDLSCSLSYVPERFNSRGCKYHCDHEGIRSGICYCGKKL